MEQFQTVHVLVFNKFLVYKGGRNIQTAMILWQKSSDFNCDRNQWLKSSWLKPAISVQEVCQRIFGVCSLRFLTVYICNNVKPMKDG